MKRFDAYEIHGCHQLNEAGLPDPNGSSTETCTDAEAMFWTLYGHIPGEGVQAIGDFTSREAAEEVHYRITGLPYRADSLAATKGEGGWPVRWLIHIASPQLAVPLSQRIMLDVMRKCYYCYVMITSYRDKRTRSFAKGQRVKAFDGIERKAQMRLDRLDAATSLLDLDLPGHRLEALKGNRKGQFSLRINDQWRVCFEWPNGASGPGNVEIVDYH